MNQKQYEMYFWKQYRQLEQELIQSRMFIEFDNINFNSFSSAYTKLLLEIGSEVDNVMREMCSLAGRSDISTYAETLLRKYPNIVSQEVKILDSNLVITPFAGWNNSQPSQSLGFWQAYNNIKHDRIANRTEATLKNVLNALGGLFILETFRYYELYKNDADIAFNMPEEESKVFILDAWVVHIRPSKIQFPYPIFDDDNNTKMLL